MSRSLAPLALLGAVSFATGWFLAEALWPPRRYDLLEPMPLPENDRERWVLEQVERGGVPPRLLRFVAVPVRDGRGNAGTIFVSPDYLGIGDDASYLRTPLSAPGAQRAADLLGALLPTRKMVDDIEAEARLRGGIIPFAAFAPIAGESRNSKRLWEQSNRAVEARLTPGKPVYAGHKKDLLVGPEATRNPGKVVIYGGLWADGRRVQPPSAAHAASYRDYSHGVRLVRPTMIANGVERSVAEVAADPTLSGLVVEGGPARSLRYQG